MLWFLYKEVLGLNPVIILLERADLGLFMQILKMDEESSEKLQALDRVLSCKGVKASWQELTSLHESSKLLASRSTQRGWWKCIAWDESLGETPTFENKLRVPNYDFAKQTPIFKFRFSKTNSDFQESYTDFQVQFLCPLKTSGLIFLSEMLSSDCKVTWLQQHCKREGERKGEGAKFSKVFQGSCLRL